MNNYGFKKTIKDLSGQQFGKWTVIKLAGRDKKNDSLWLCRCECGTEKTVSGYSLRHGRSKGCIKCACIKKNEDRFNAAKTIDRALAAVQMLVYHGHPLADVLTRLQEERNKLNT